ncbi:unnamed protein product [Prorocentrum cordatum]|uniref:Uncharacterized protein n=1 Tax=Prorocentrum cordatum TaxID=2364126 RepID=A0ABN9TI48_9DINO|nr:unnamed protein product [Polarella glacialis]
MVVIWMAAVTIVLTFVAVEFLGLAVTLGVLLGATRGLACRFRAHRRSRASRCMLFGKLLSVVKFLVFVMVHGIFGEFLMFFVEFLRDVRFLRIVGAYLLIFVKFLRFMEQFLMIVVLALRFLINVVLLFLRFFLLVKALSLMLFAEFVLIYMMVWLVLFITILVHVVVMIMMFTSLPISFTKSLMIVALLVFSLLVSLALSLSGAGLPTCLRCGFFFLRYKTFFSDLRLIVSFFMAVFGLAMCGYFCLLYLSFMFRLWWIPRWAPRSLPIPFVSMVFAYIETT